MSSLIECMQQECARRDLSYTHEMASLVCAWLGVAQVDDGEGSVADRILGGKMPVNLSDVPRSPVKPAPTSTDQLPPAVHASPPATNPNSRAYRSGVKAALAGIPPQNNPYAIKVPGGKLAANWTAGYHSTQKKPTP